jgi:hypothetical protein
MEAPGVAEQSAVKALSDLKGKMVIGAASHPFSS